MIFPIGSKQYQSGRCICSMGNQCNQAKSTFRAAEDIRGQLAQLPNVSSSSRHTFQKEKTEQWLKRTAHHWKTISYESLSNLSNQTDKANLPPATRTREQLKTQNSQPSTVKKVSRICLAHFHPKLIEKYGSRIPKAIAESEAQLLGLYNKNGGSFYSKADTILDENGKRLVLLLPIYPLKEALSDAKNSQDIYKMRTEIKRVTTRRTTTTSSLRKNPTDPPSIQESTTTPSSSSSSSSSGEKKRKRAEPSVEELKAEVERLSRRNKKLEEELLKEKNNYSDLLRRFSFIEKCMRHQKEQIDEQADKTVQLKLEEKLNEEMVSQLKLFEASGAGLNRISITSRDYLARKECRRLCNQLYGFTDFEYLICLIEAFFDIEYIKPTKLEVDTRNPLSKVEQVLLTLVWCNTRWNDDVIGLLFGIKCRQTVEVYVNKWLPLLGERGDMMSDFLHLLDPESIDKLEPASYQELGLKNIAAVLDGKDYQCETVRSHRVLNCAQASNKIHASAFRNLTWSLPCGGVIERTPAFLGRFSEKAIMCVWGSTGRLVFPKEYLILADKGFDFTAAFYVNFNTSLHPAFLHDKKFSESQIQHNMKICQKRYSCEVVYSRVAAVGKLDGTIKREWFQHFESLLGWAHGRANLAYAPLQEIKNKEVYSLF